MKNRMYFYSQAVGNLSVGDLYNSWGGAVTAFPHYLNCLLYSHKLGDSDLLHESLDKCLRVLKEFPNVLEDEKTQGVLDDIKECLLQILDERAYQIYALFFPLSGHEKSQSQKE